MPDPFPAVGAGPQYRPVAIVGTETPAAQGGGIGAGWDSACAELVVSDGIVLAEDGAVGNTDDDTAGETDDDAWVLAQPAVTATKTATMKIILTAVYDDEHGPLGSPDLVGVSDTTGISTVIRPLSAAGRHRASRPDRRSRVGRGWG